MEKESRNVVQLGLFVIIALALFIIAIYYIGSRQNLFGASFRISAFFTNVNGLQTGNNVRFAGIDIGSVKDILIINDTCLRVDMILQKGAQDFIKKDAVAHIASDGLVGNMIVNIEPGKGMEAPIKNGETIASTYLVSTKDLLNTLSYTNENVALLSLYLLEISKDVKDGPGTISLFLRDSILAFEIQQSIQNFEQTSQHLLKMSRNLNESVAAINAGEGNLGYLLKDTSLAANVNQLTNQIDQMFDHQISPILNNLSESSQDITLASASLKKLLQDIDLQEGLLGAILKDSIAPRDFQETLHNLNEGTAKFNKNMEALQHNFFFRGYFKKQERKAKKAQKKKN